MVAPLLLPAAVGAAALTLRGDTRPATVYVKSPRGTLYWGGAGLDGSYVQPTLAALQAAGIRHVNVGLTNTAAQQLYARLGMLVDAVRAGIVIRYEDDGEWVISSGMQSEAPQFNLVGYSYGSLLAAQTAHFYARSGYVVDHLVLIASPIDNQFLATLKAYRSIRKVVVIDLKDKGDPLYAGITQPELLNPAVLLKLYADESARKGQGHFYYAHPVRDLAARLASLAEKLVAGGLR